MADEFTEVTSQSWFGRILNAVKGIAFGFLFIAGSVYLLSWNEGRSVATAKSLKEGSGAVVSVEASAVNPANDKKLVHVSGAVTASPAVRDPLFGVSAPAIRLTRKVEMYQWRQHEKSETHKKLGGGSETETTYSYEKAWADEPVDSSRFKVAEGHANPKKMLASRRVEVAPKVTLGAFQLGAGLIAKMSGDVQREVADADLAALSGELKAKAKTSDGTFYFGQDPAAPAIGDQRVTFTVLNPGDFSVIARQTGGTFDPYPTHAGKTIERVESGIVGADVMFQHAAKENAVITWLLRLGGYILMAIGIAMVLGLASVLGDVIPFLGDLIGAGVGIVAMVLALAGTAVTIAVAWIAVRPVLAGGLLVAAVAWLVFGGKFLRRKAA